jgi:glycosyltransferase involved in cell wall biosynthesis
MTSLGVVVTAFRRRNYLGSAFESLAQQTRRPDEVVLIEDNPPYEDAGAQTLAQKVLPASVRLKVRNGSFEDAGTMLVTGVKECDTDVVCFLEDDDIFTPGKLASIEKTFLEHPEVGYIHNGQQILDVDLHPIATRNSVKNPPSGVVPPEPSEWSRYRVMGNVSSMSLRRAPVLPNVQDLWSVQGGQDFALVWLALRSDQGIYADAEVLTKRRVYAESAHRQRSYPRRQYDSVQRLLERSRHGQPEEKLCRWELSTLAGVVEKAERAFRPNDYFFRVVNFLEAKAPPASAARIRRAKLALMFAFNR